MSLIKYPKYVSVIKNKSNILGFQHNNQNYIIGFQQKKHAILVHKDICKESVNNIKLFRHYTENIGDAVSQGLHNLGFDESYDDIKVDLNATLIIPKSENCINDNELTIEDLEFEEFLMYPFNKHIGISLPYELCGENNNFLFEAQVIDPCNDINLFRKKLHI